MHVLARRRSCTVSNYLGAKRELSPLSPSMRAMPYFNIVVVVVVVVVVNHYYFDCYYY